MVFVPEFFSGTVSSIWFTDKDDGTLIHIFDGGGSFSSDGTRCPTPDFLFAQNVELGSCNELDDGPDEEIVCPGVGTITRGSFKLSIDLSTPLPADHSFTGGSISRLDDRLVMYVEEFTPSRVGEDTALIGLQKFDPVKTFITRYDFVNTESLGTSNGNESQTFTVSGSDILLPTTGTPIIFVGGIESGDRWSVTDDLSEAGATATVFEYDPAAGEVTFGDGVNGAIPESGKEIVLRITIRNGGGQWTFIGIVEPPKDTKNIGGVKSIRDKTFYVQTGIALADAGKMTTVAAKVNGVEQSAFLGTPLLDKSNLLSITTIYNIAIGGEVNAAGGEIVLFGAGGTGFVEELPPNTDPDIIHLEIDTNVVYPSFKGIVPPRVPAPTSPVFSFQNPQYSFNETIEGGVHTTPKIYEDAVRLRFIFYVQETRTFRSIVGSNLLDDPVYDLSFTAGNFGVGSGVPIINDRIKRLIKIGDPNPPPNMLNGDGEEWTGGEGTFDDPVQQGIFVDNSVGGPESVTGRRNRVTVDNATYTQVIIGSNTSRIDEFATIEYENRQSTRDAALATHIRGSALPGFVCKFTFERGDLIVAPSL